MKQNRLEKLAPGFILAFALVLEAFAAYLIFS